MFRKKIIWFFVFALFLRLVLAFLVWHRDVYNHMDWGERFWSYGAAKFYAPETNVWGYLWPNQPPGTIYIFAIIYKFYKLVFSFFWWINISIPIFPSRLITFFETNLYPALLKFPAILADFGIACLIYKVLKLLPLKIGQKILFFGKEKRNFEYKEWASSLGALIFLFNPIVWYNSSVWGQYDSVIFFLAFISFYFLIQKKSVLATLFYTLSLYTKLTLIVFAPLFLIFYIKRKYKLGEYFKSVALPIIVVGFLTYSFSQTEPFSWLFNLYKNKILVEQRQVVTSNAFNIWAGLTGIHQISHNNLFGPISFKTWGLALFFVSYFLPFYLVLRKKDLKTLLWSLAIVSISSFSLLTNMHERYLFSFFPIVTILIFLERRLLLFYVLITVLNLLNLYNFWWVPEISFLKSFLSANGGYYARILGYFEFFLYLYFYRFFVRNFRK